MTLVFEDILVELREVRDEYKQMKYEIKKLAELCKELIKSHDEFRRTLTK